MSSLLPPNATATEQALETTTKRTTDLPVNLRNLWNPNTCPVQFLPWLAWTLSLDSWQPYWSEAVKRERIRRAVEIQRHKGTVRSVRDVVSSFGSYLAMRQWFETTPKGTPHTFEIVLTLGASVPNTAAYQEDIIAEINRVKPTRSRFTFTAGLSATGRIGLGGAIRLAHYRRLEMTEAPFTTGIGLQGTTRHAVYARIETTEA